MNLNCKLIGIKFRENKMEFMISEWRIIYDAVQREGKDLQDSMETYCRDSRSIINPINEISIDEQRDLDDRIKALRIMSNNYLTSCGIKPKRALWKYNIHDKKTWASDDSFAYGHLVK